MNLPPYFCVLAVVLSLTGCTKPSEKASDYQSNGTLDSNSIVLTSKERVFWSQEPDEGYSHPDYGNPVAIPFNNSGDVVDTVAFRKFFGLHAGIEFLDSIDTDVRRFIIKYQQSEICLIQELNYNFPATTKLYSAMIRDKEIPLKNGVTIGMFKKQVLDKYPFVKEPADVIYVKDDDGSIIRFEFKDNRLTYIEFWGNVPIRDDFGGLQIFRYSEVYDPLPESLDKEYFIKLLGPGTTLDTDTISYESESEQGKKIQSNYYRYLVTNENSQFELIDHTGKGTYLVMKSAILSTPQIILNDSIYIGVSRQKVLKRFELQDFTSGYNVFWLLTRGKRFRFTFSNNVLTSMEFANGTL